MISLILVIIASIFSAIMDNIKDHWYKSIFNKLNPSFFNPEVSWKNKYTIYHINFKIPIIKWKKSGEL